MEGKENLKFCKGTLIGSITGLAVLMLLFTVTAWLMPELSILQTSCSTAGKICLLLSSVFCGTISSRSGTGKKLLRSLAGVICLWFLIAVKALFTSENGSWAKLGSDLLWMLMGGAGGAMFAVSKGVSKKKRKLYKT